MASNAAGERIADGVRVRAIVETYQLAPYWIYPKTLLLLTGWPLWEGSKMTTQLAPSLHTSLSACIPPRIAPKEGIKKKGDMFSVSFFQAPWSWGGGDYGKHTILWGCQLP